MLEFKSAEDLRKLSPEDDGWIVVIEEPDKDRVLTEIWSDWTLLDIP